MKDRINEIRETNAMCHSIGASNLTTTAISVLLDNCDFLLAEIDRLTEAQGWIPVTERLPDDGEWVLALRFGRTHHLACYQHGHWMRRVGLVDKITHWMPLPAPPEKGE